MPHRKTVAPGFAPSRNTAALCLSLALLLLLSAALCGCGLIGPLVSTAAPLAGTKLMFSCIPVQTGIDTPGGARPIEQLEAGDFVIGFGGKTMPILQKHSYREDPATLFLRIIFADGASVDLCGMHRIAGVRAREIRIGQSLAGREVTGIESRRGVTLSFDLLTEDAGYQIQGVPVNSMIQEMLAASSSRTRPAH